MPVGTIISLGLRFQSECKSGDLGSPDTQYGRSVILVIVVRLDMLNVDLCTK